MPKRRQKGTDTQKEDSFEEEHQVDKTYTFGTIQVNRFLPPDELAEDDPNKYSIRSWTHVLMAHKLIPWPQRKQLFERALKCLPNSYKIWHEYLVEFKDYCEQRSLFCTDYEQLNKKFQEALKFLPKMPRIWLLYTQTLANQNLISKTRQVYNWSFRNLPLTQHQKIWSKFAPWTFTLSNPRTAIQVINRYLQLNPDFKQNYSDYLRQRGQFDLSAKVINDILKDDGYHSKQGKSKYDFLCDLIELIIQQPSKIKSINGEQVIRKAIIDHPNESANFWVKLCSYFIRLAQFQDARQSFQTALNQIDNAKDFNLIFSTYTKFEQQMLMALQNQGIRKQENVTQEDRIHQQIEQRLSKLESLIDRRPYMLSNINIKKQPNFVKFWIRLAQLHKSAGNNQAYLETLIKATETIASQQAQNGHLSEIWVLYANYYKEQSDFAKFNQISMKSTQINYRTVDDYITSWTKWCESLIQLNYSQDALQIIKYLLLKRKTPSNPDLKIKKIDDILKSSAVLWSLYIDLELSIGSFDTAKKAYQRCRQHKSLNPLMLLNYINLLWQRNHFEQVFRVFEYAISEFKWPYVYQIWLSYVNKFVERYGPTPIGVERTRSIFERLLKDVPPNQCKIFYFIYAEFEQEYGLYSHAIQIYDRMISVVPEQEKFQCYNIYIAKISQLLGVTKTRAVFEAALQSLSEDKIVLMALKYAQLEKNLNEVDRARQVYSYASQFTDPKDDYQGLWKTWEQFELAEGNKENYEIYLRVKRSVINKYNMLPPDLRRIEQNVRKGVL